MDLINKRIKGISGMLACFGMLILYTQIGAIGMMYVAITFEILSLLNLLFFASLPKNISSGWYYVFASVTVEVILYFIYRFILLPSNIMFVSTLIVICMFLVPVYVCLQWFKGLYQVTVHNQLGALADFIFVISAIVISVILNIILGDYGHRAADFMQSIKLQHFYVILCVVFSFFFACIFALIFLFWAARRYRGKITFALQELRKKDTLTFRNILQMFTTQLSGSYLSIIQKIPVWLLLILSVKELKNENYLFGHLYGAVFPLLGLVWQLASIGLIVAKKHLYLYYKKRSRDSYYDTLKMILSYVVVSSTFLFACVFALHKPYLAIWSLQTSSTFMQLTKTSACIALLGLPYITLLDVLEERNRRKACRISILLGVLMFVITAIICNHFLGAGNALYVVSIVLQLLVTIFFLTWFLGNEVGISYFSILKNTYKVLASHILLTILLIVVQSFIYTAFGAFGTLTICLTISFIIQWISVRAFRVFTKEERKTLSVLTILKAALQIPYESE